MFLVAYLVKMPGIQAVAAVWYCTLGVRGYRLVLMLLPSAKRALAYERYRCVLRGVQQHAAASAAGCRHWQLKLLHQQLGAVIISRC